MNKEIKNRNLEQLKQYVKWDMENHPDAENRKHVLQWAVEEIENLRTKLNKLEATQ